MQKNVFKKSMALMLCLTLLVTAFSFVGTASSADVDFKITNPYETVDWESWDNFRLSLHNHSWVSDGRDNFKDMVERHYELGYDALAMTDHGTVDYGWIGEVNRVDLLETVLELKRKSSEKPYGLTPERYEEITTGVGRNGRPMIRIPYGIEQNPTSLNSAHVNSWFVDYGNAILGGTSDYETPIKEVNKLGGVSVINHPGEYTRAKKENNPDKAYDSSYAYKIDKFANLLIKYHTCIGIDVNSKNDGRTKNDRKLWDILLQKVVPTGRNVFAIGSSDAHSLSAIDTGWVIAVMPENTVENIKTALLTGTFFAGSRHIKNSKELAILSAEVGRDLGKEWEANPEAPEPVVTGIFVDEAEDTIRIEAVNAETIHWIADGKVIAVGNEIDLDDYADQVGCYVRAEIFGDGGILYSQPFILEHDNAPKEGGVKGFFDFGNLLAMIRKFILTLFAPIIK
ncbi:MAG TPA: PHP domain-containing protein [Clostridiales bacterium]|nr:PHP domain-containing protein [Clostridiales bacterium]